VLGKGAKVYTESVEGIRMETEYLIFESPTEISIKMLNKSPIFKCFIGTWKYIQIENKKTRLKITYQFSLRFPYNLITSRVSKKINLNMTQKLYFLESYLDIMKNKKVSNI
jgi:ribosome-associated toxin RatA of RatAB toxin-antitoxin module